MFSNLRGWKCLVPDDASLHSSSFFELGGNSLSAIRVISLVKAHGLSLEFGSFFRCVSLVDMARATSSIMGMSDLQTLVPLNFSRELRSHLLNGAKDYGNANTDIDKSPLFVVHDAKGTVWKLLELARLLPFIMIGIQSGGASSEINNPDSVEQLADKYWRAIQSMQPEGPYCLGGFSFGCRVAHAVARLASEQGYDVKPLLLLNGLPVTLQDPLLYASFDPSSLRDNISKEYPSKRTASATEKPHEHCAETEFLDHVTAQFVAHCAMDVKYQPYNYYSASYLKQSDGMCLSKDLVRGGITLELHQVPGTHSTLLQRPNVISCSIHSRAFKSIF